MVMRGYNGKDYLRRSSQPVFHCHLLGFFGLLLFAFFVRSFDGFFKRFAPFFEVVFSVHC